MSLLERIREKAKKKMGRIVLPEGDDERIIKAAEEITAQGIAQVVVLGKREKVDGLADNLGVNLKGVRVLDPEEEESLSDYAQRFQELRKKKPFSFKEAQERMREPLFFGAMMLRLGEVDGYVAGAAHSTADTLRAGLQVVGLAPGIEVCSGAFLMIVPHLLGESDKPLLFADCAVVPEPTSSQLASIAVSSAQTYRELVGDEPYVAILSFSTKGSARHSLVEKVKEATRLAQEVSPQLKLDGELQADAALIPQVAQKKAPQSEVAGKANVLIFPDLNSGNISYKLVQRLAGAQAIGPIIQGLSRPANDLSRGCNVDDVVNLAAITLAMS